MARSILIPLVPFGLPPVTTLPPTAVPGSGIIA